MEHGYGRYLTWLALNGGLVAAAAPETRLTPELLRGYTAELGRLNAVQTVLSRLNELDMFARATMPTLDRGFLRDLQPPIRRHGGPKAKVGRLRHATELLELGLRLMDEAVGPGLSRRQASIGFRDGLIIALLALRPLRRANFTALEIGRHLLRRGETWWLMIPAAEVKNRRPIELPFPESLTAALQCYLSTYRPALAASSGRWQSAVGNRLWLSSDGSPLTEMALYDRVAAHTRAAFGRAVNPHLFRDCAATSLAIDDPAHVRLGAQLLGHASFATTERYYRLSRSIEAAQACHTTLQQLRQPEDD